MRPAPSRGPALLLALLCFAVLPPPAQAYGHTAPGITTDPAAVWGLAGTTWNDLEDEAHNDIPADVPVGTSVGDALHIGHPNPFDQALVQVSTAGAGGQVVWEYWNGTAWRELRPSDASDGFTRTGARIVAWVPPNAWLRKELHASAVGEHYYVRARVTDAYTTAPALGRVQVEAWSDPTAAVLETAHQWGARRPLPTMDLKGADTAGNVVLAVGSSSSVAAGTGIILRSPDGGERWETVASTAQAFTDVSLLDPQRAVVTSSSGAIHRSTDGGRTWASIGPASSTTELKGIQWIDEQTLVAVGKKVLRSSDGGATWREPDVKDWGDLATFEDVDFRSPTHGWIVGGESGAAIAYQTDDGGATWEEADFLPSAPAAAKAVSFSGADSGWIVGDKFRAQWDTTLAAGRWTVSAVAHDLNDVLLTNATLGWMVGANAIYRYNSSRNIDFDLASPEGFSQGLNAVAARGPHIALGVGRGGFIYRTIHEGASWAQPGGAQPGDLHGIDMLPNGLTWAVGELGTVMRSADGGLNWTLMAQPDPTQPLTLRDVDFIDATKGWAVGDAGQVWHTTDGGWRWTKQPLATGAAQAATAAYHLKGVVFFDGTNGWVVGDSGRALCTRSGGAPSGTEAGWTDYPTSATDPIDLRAVDGVGNFNSGTILVAGGNSVLSRTSSCGVGSWTTKKSTDNSLNGIRAIDSRVWAAGAQGKIWTSSDGGLTWRGMTLSGGDLSDVDASGSQVAWAVGASGIWRTNDGGASWINLAKNVPLATLNGVAGRAESRSAAIGSQIQRTDRNFTFTTAPDAGGPSLNPNPSHASGDSFYMMRPGPFDSVAVRVSNPTTGARVAWEYWNGGAWKSLPTRDASSGFNVTGLSIVKFAIPADWANRTVAPSRESGHWIRARIGVASTTIASLNETGTLRMIVGLPPPGGPRATRTDSPNGNFAMSVEPRTIDFGGRARGATVEEKVMLTVTGRSANSIISVEGPAAAWIRVGRSQIAFEPGRAEEVPIELVVPAEASPGPTTARVVFTSLPQGDTEPIQGWVDLTMKIQAADVTAFTYSLAPARWSARFVNHLPSTVAARIDASITPVGGTSRPLEARNEDVRAGAELKLEHELPADLAAGAYDLRLESQAGADQGTRTLRVFVGGPPVAVQDLVVAVDDLEHVRVIFNVKNDASVPVNARPIVRIYDKFESEVATIEPDAMPLDAGASQTVEVPWEPVFGTFRAAVTAQVENAEGAHEAESSFAVRGSPPLADPPLWEQRLPMFGLALVGIVNIVVGLGLWTGRKKT